MTGIIRFPRGGRPNKVTKPPATTAQAQQTRRAANGSNGSAAGASTGRQLAIEQALSEQQQQQQQQQQEQEQNQQEYATATSTEITDNLSPEQAQSSIQDGPYYSTDGDQAQTHTAPHTHTDGDATDYGAKDQTDGNHSQEDDSNIKADRQDGVDSDMLDLHSGGGDGDGSTTHNVNGHSENMVTDINEAEMSEMVGDAVNSYTGGGENGVGVGVGVGVARQAQATEAQSTPSNGHSSHGIDMDLSAAAAAAAAAAAVASASHLATTGQTHVINHLHNHYHDQTTDYNPSAHAPEAQMVEAQHQPVADNTVDTQPAPVDPTITAAPEPSKDDPTSSSTTPASTADLARDSGYNHLVVESALARRLSREPGLRPAQQRRPDQQLNLGRRSNVEALFAHIAGAEVAVPCKNCHKGHGPWTACVVVDGQMCGSCANCWFNASGARCSFHETKTTSMQGHLHGHPGRQSLGGGVPPSPSTVVPSALDPQLAAAAAAGTYIIGSPLGGGGANSVHHHFAAQQQQLQQQLQQHQHQNSLPSASATPPSSSSASQQAAAAAAAAAVAVQQLSTGGHFPVPPPPPNGSSPSTNGVASNNNSSNGITTTPSAPASATASPFSLDLVTALLGANRGDATTSSVAADSTPLVSLVINQALAEVRNADQRGRDLMLVEIAAKQLALAIVRYGEGASTAAAAAAASSSVVPAAGDVAASVSDPSAVPSTVKDGVADGGNTDGTAPTAAE